MLMSILYNNAGQMIAAAPACDQQPHGDRYWLDAGVAVVSHQSPGTTSVVEIANTRLVQTLLDLVYEPSIMTVARMQLANYLREANTGRARRERHETFSANTPKKIVHPKAA